MNMTKICLSLKFSLLVLLITSAAVGVIMSIAAQSSNVLSETAPLPFGEKVAVTGEIVMIEGNVQIIEDPSGKKTDVYMMMENLYVAQAAGNEAIQFHVNDKTRVEQDLKVGDTVEVLAAQNGEALSIKKAE